MACLEFAFFTEVARLVPNEAEHDSINTLNKCGGFVRKNAFFSCSNDVTSINVGSWVTLFTRLNNTEFVACTVMTFNVVIFPLIWLSSSS